MGRRGREPAYYAEKNAEEDEGAKNGSTQVMAVRLLRGLVDKGALRFVGGGKKTRYMKV